MDSESTISEESLNFIKEAANDSYCLQIILFFAGHPYAQFNELAIIHALNHDGERRYLQRALGVLVDKAMIKTHMDSKTLVYLLADNMRSLASELAKLD